MNSVREIVVKQRLGTPIGSSLIFIVCGVVMIGFVIIGIRSSTIMFMWIVPAIFAMIFPLLIPIARIEFDKTGIQLITTRMLGLSERVSLRFEYDEIDRVECARYSFFFTAKERGIIVHSSRDRIVAGAIFSLRDRKSMASLLRDLSTEHDFEFSDEARLTKG